MITVFDLETTGFSGSYCDVIQFSYVQLEDDGRFHKADTMYFYHKGMHWDQSVCDNVHHIELSFLEKFEDKFDENLIKMFTILSKADVVGHNAIGFDCPFASQWLQRNGLPGLMFSSIRDTMKIYQPLTKTARVKLEKLCNMCHITPELVTQMENNWFGTVSVHHNANYDTSATALLIVNAIKTGMVQFGDQPVVRRDITTHKVCEGFYVKTVGATYYVDIDGARTVNSAPDELVLPPFLKSTGPTTFAAMKDGNGIVLDISDGSCILHMNGAVLNTMKLTMPIGNLKTLLNGMLGGG